MILMLNRRGYNDIGMRFSASFSNKPINGVGTVINCSPLPSEYRELRWYAAYTSANHEKRVAEQLAVRAVDHFLPLYSSVRRWKDRRVVLKLPLFPGYVFVHMALRDKLRVQQVPGVARLVGFDGTPATLPEEEIEALKRGLASGVLAEPHPFLTVGRSVRVKRGPFEGRRGILLRRRGSLRLVLSLDLISRSIVTDVEAADVEPILEGGALYCATSGR
jgi:transcription antitermination factor NusG